MKNHCFGTIILLTKTPTGFKMQQRIYNTTNFNKSKYTTYIIKYLLHNLHTF